MCNVTFQTLILLMNIIVTKAKIQNNQNVDIFTINTRLIFQCVYIVIRKQNKRFRGFYKKKLWIFKIFKIFNFLEANFYKNFRVTRGPTKNFGQIGSVILTSNKDKKSIFINTTQLLGFDGAMVNVFDSSYKDLPNPVNCKIKI